MCSQHGLFSRKHGKLFLLCINETTRAPTTTFVEQDLRAGSHESHSIRWRDVVSGKTVPLPTAIDENPIMYSRWESTLFGFGCGRTVVGNEITHRYPGFVFH
jgi:hypothetical protein